MVLIDRLRRWHKQQERTCLDCGFISFDGSEVSKDERLHLGAEGKAGWFAHPEHFDCKKGRWLPLGQHDATQVILDETQIVRAGFGYRRCKGFLKHIPGRSPAEHLKLEDDSREFYRKLMIALIAAIAGLLATWIKK